VKPELAAEEEEGEEGRAVGGEDAREGEAAHASREGREGGREGKGVGERKERVRWRRYNVLSLKEKKETRRPHASKERREGGR